MSTSASIDIAANLQQVRDRVDAASAARTEDKTPVRLVAVSKTKPIELLQSAYDAGCRNFGENYVQELVEKAPQLPDDIHWHFIGALQSNKANMLVKAVKSATQLTVETVSSMKIANKLNNAVPDDGGKLKVFVQVNTSGEDTKSGMAPGDECVALCEHITQNCPKLELRGLMTIGAPGDLSCFEVLKDCRSKVAEALGVEEDDLELSMGMSGDFEQAIAAGSTNVRVGSTIFGERDYSKKK